MPHSNVVREIDRSLQAAPDEARDFVEPLLRQHEIRHPRIELDQLVLIGRELEEIALFLDPFDRRALRSEADAGLPDAGFILVVIGFVAHRIPAGIIRQVDVAVLLHALPDRLRRAMVALFRGADEVIVRTVQPFDHGLEARHVARHQIGRRDAFARRGLQHLDAVLVGAGQEVHVVTVEPLEARDRIGRDRLVGMTDVRRTVGIGDRGRQVVATRLFGLRGRRSRLRLRQRRARRRFLLGSDGLRLRSWFRLGCWPRLGCPRLGCGSRLGALALGCLSQRLARAALGLARLLFGCRASCGAARAFPAAFLRDLAAAAGLRRLTFRVFDLVFDFVFLAMVNRFKRLRDDPGQRHRWPGRCPPRAWACAAAASLHPQAGRARPTMDF